MVSLIFIGLVVLVVHPLIFLALQVGDIGQCRLC